MRRILIIIAVVIVLLGGVAAIYFFFFAPSAARLTVSSNGAFGDTTAGNAPAAIQAAQVGVPLSGAGTAVAPNLIQITKSPVAEGMAVFDTVVGASTSGSSTVSTSTDVKVRFIDRQSGNIYEYGALSRTLTRITAKTLPGIQQASWVSDGSMAFTRFLATAAGTQIVDTYALPANNDSGYFLAQNLSQASVIGSSTLFTLAAGTDSSVGSVSRTDGSAERTIFTSPLTAITVESAQGRYLAITDAAATMDGYILSLSSSGTFTPIVGPLYGLTARISPSGSEVLYSYTDGSTFHMNILNLSTGTVTALPIATIADKCVWKSDSSGVICAIPTAFSGNLPDDWYQGTVSFNDRIWDIDLSTRIAKLVIDPSTLVKNGIDAVSLSVDPSGRILSFVNKKDDSLWAVSL